MSAFSTVVATNPHSPQSHVRKLCMQSNSSLHAACRKQSGQYDPIPKILGLSALLITTFYLRDSTQRQAAIVAPASIVKVLSPLDEAIFKRFK